MTNVQLKNELYYIGELAKIKQQLTEWDFRPLKGIGAFTKAETYAHIEIKIYQSDSDSYSSRSKVIWNTDEKYFPYDISISKVIEQYFIFFTDYLSLLKGEELQLIFEVTDGTRHVADFRDKTYGYAVLYALINCFDKSYNRIDVSKSKWISEVRATAPEFFKSAGIHFTTEELFRSLENVALTKSIKELINEMSDEELSLYLERCDEYRLNLRITPKLLEKNTEWFKENKILSPNGGRLSYIGLWHIAIASRNAYFFARYFGIYNDPELKKYMDLHKPSPPSGQ